MPVEKRPLGSQGLVASAQGLGTMGMTAAYNLNPNETEEESLRTIDKALEIGINFFDTAWIYQHFQTGKTNEELLGKAIAKHGRDKFVIATKFGITVTATGPSLDSKPETIRQQLGQSLQRLGTDYVDLYYQHRHDPATPLEVVIETLKELVNEGKVRYIGLSECTPAELRKAHAIHPITAIEMEWSLQTRDIEKDLLPVARELGVAIVAYSPLGRGFLSQAFTKPEDIPEGDWRKSQPRFQSEVFDESAKAAAKLKEIADRKGYTPGQLALAWLHNQGKDVFPIPGTKSVNRIIENAKAAEIVLTAEEIQEISDAVPPPSAARYESEALTYQSRI
eukprot:NODE_4202_length_1207_cov_147.404059_g3703_i0.p1 GENE.NODE_4202_length_1207_cov_147.404059_g3703_i0~~NODE_4202_length_1207_cov_147.404059_g3703_i0.p1  ORF type:complete len:336 (-),score=85.38 NODE_4202_length_1207_cov_147.404059_g3703_i0:144-1151(-)